MDEIPTYMHFLVNVNKLLVRSGLLDSQDNYVCGENFSVRCKYDRP